MSKPMLRLVRESDTPPPAVSDDADAARIEAEYHQALLLLDISDYERANGPNAYTTYVRKHEKRPPPAEARAIGLVVGMRVKADDGRFYPKKTKAEREFERQRKSRQEAFAVRLARSSSVYAAVKTLAEIDISPEEIDLLQLHEPEIATKLTAALEWLSRFADSRAYRDKVACSHHQESHRRDHVGPRA